MAVTPLRPQIPEAEGKKIQRLHWTIHGVVQGVGFRPYVHRIASELLLAGWVQNGMNGVEIETQGNPDSLKSFLNRLIDEAPRLAIIDLIEVQELIPVDHDVGFEVVHSQHTGVLSTMTSPDSAVCPWCLHEMFTPTDRRYRYAFINCTHCGPRYTLIKHLPYDRSMTSMAKFEQCSACEKEYRDPAHRRFHAEPNACPACGPQLTFIDRDGVFSGDAVSKAIEYLRAGRILAVKGLGGFHLVCDAKNKQAVQELRRRKNRPDKPFALMMLNEASVREWCNASETQAALLSGVARPIVLLPCKAERINSLESVSPGVADLGVMLPYTPLHYLLFHEYLECPEGLSWLEAVHPLVLVMTSANPSGEPLVIDNEEALVRLGHIADGWLLHDRDIVSRCDDSVVFCRDDAKSETRSSLQMVRRARGYTPSAITLGCAGDTPSILAVGGFFKNTFCLTRGQQAFLSPHIGSLDNAATCQAFDETLEHFLSLLEVKPSLIACDLHPEFYSTQAAYVLSNQWEVPLLEVQHHHAHIASVVAEHHLPGPVLGLAFDGIGLGIDVNGKRSAWGGELLSVDGEECQRLGHVTPLFLAGGDRAAREPWRLAASVLAQLNRTDDIACFFGKQQASAVVTQQFHYAVQGITQSVAQTTSLGRWFDAAAAALDICLEMSYEGQAAMMLEATARSYVNKHKILPCDASLYKLSNAGILDLYPLVECLFDISDPEYGAALFHGTLIHALKEWVMMSVAEHNIQTLVGSGGCWMNQLLSEGLREGVEAAGCSLWLAEKVPANDGGLSLGQAWIAIKSLQNKLKMQ